MGSARADILLALCPLGGHHHRSHARGSAIPSRPNAATTSPACPGTLPASHTQCVRTGRSRMGWALLSRHGLRRRPVSCPHYALCTAQYLSAWPPRRRTAAPPATHAPAATRVWWGRSSSCAGCVRRRDAARRGAPALGRPVQGGVRRYNEEQSTTGIGTCERGRQSSAARSKDQAKAVAVRLDVRWQSTTRRIRDAVAVRFDARL